MPSFTQLIVNIFQDAIATSPSFGLATTIGSLALRQSSVSKSASIVSKVSARACHSPKANIEISSKIWVPLS
jgi:hypothetical protein